MGDFDAASLLGNMGRLHTTPMGAKRIKKNFALDADAVAFCKTRILDDGCVIRWQGKKWYCEAGGARITVNAHSLTIITAHPTDSVRLREKGGKSAL